MSLKCLVVGSGSFAQKHAHIFGEMEDVSVVGFVGRNGPRAEGAAARLAASTGSRVTGYDNLETALSETRPDMAVVAVIPGSHGPVEQALIERNIPFLVEKPIGSTPDIPEDIARRVEESGLITSVAFHMRYYDTNPRFSGYLAASTPVLGNGFWMGQLPPPAWWRHVAESGGQFVEQTIHMIDLLRFFLGEVESVYAVTSQAALKSLHSDADVPDAGAAVLRMKSGITATLINSCVGPVAGRIGLEVVTTDGFLEHRFGTVTMRNASEAVEVRPTTDPYKTEDEAFVTAVRTGDRSGILAPYDDALRSHRVAMAITASAKSGGQVNL